MFEWIKTDVNDFTFILLLLLIAGLIYLGYRIYQFYQQSIAPGIDRFRNLFNF